MAEDGILIERAIGLIRCCKLPRLSRSIDDAPLQLSTFKDFKLVLDDILPKIFDLISHHRNQLIVNDEFNQDNLEFRTKLALVIGEQVRIGDEDDTCDFQTANKTHQEQLRRMYEYRILEELLTAKGSENLRKKLWEHYHTVLSSKEWVFHPGDIHSFTRICEFLYGGLLIQQPNLDQSVASFMLSVGICLIEYHDPTYQMYGLKLFNILLNIRHQPMLNDSNIHEVIFKNVFRLVVKTKREPFVRELWKCYFQYVVLTETKRTDFSMWSNVDDIMEALLEALAFEQNLALSSILLFNLLRLLALDLPNFIIDDLDEVQMVDSKCHLYEPVLEQLRKYCALEFHNKRFYRWHKRLLGILPFELEKACGNLREHGKYMHGVNILFVLVVFPVEPQAIGDRLEARIILVDFIIAFKCHLREQYARIQSLTTKCDFLHSLKAAVSCDKSLVIFLRSVARSYFKNDPDFWTAIGCDPQESYQEDRIFYECLKELQFRHTLGF